MLQKLKEYKEIIAIVVFFLGGFIWLESQFPKKSDLKSEIKTLNCLLEKYMVLTQLQIHGQKLEKQIQDIKIKIDSTFQINSDGTSPRLSPPMEYELEELRESLSNMKKELKNDNDEMEKVDNELARNICGKEQL